MTNEEARIRDELVKAHDERRLISCHVPGGGDMAMALERHMVDQAMDAWRTMAAEERRRTLASVRRAIKQTVKRMNKQIAAGDEIDALAADVALWLGHELLFGDGERYLIKGPNREDLCNRTVN